MKSWELSVWMAYDRIEPIALGPRLNVLAAQLESTLWNVKRTKKSDKFFSIEDCVLDMDMYREKPDPEAQAQGALFNTAMALKASQGQKKPGQLIIEAKR